MIKFTVRTLGTQLLEEKTRVRLDSGTLLSLRKNGSGFYGVCFVFSYLIKIFRFLR